MIACVRVFFHQLLTVGYYCECFVYVNNVIKLPVLFFFKMQAATVCTIAVHGSHLYNVILFTVPIFSHSFREPCVVIIKYYV